MSNGAERCTRARECARPEFTGRSARRKEGASSERNRRHRIRDGDTRIGPRALRDARTNAMSSELLARRVLGLFDTTTLAPFYDIRDRLAAQAVEDGGTVYLRWLEATLRAAYQIGLANELPVQDF